MKRTSINNGNGTAQSQGPHRKLQLLGSTQNFNSTGQSALNDSPNRRLERSWKRDLQNQLSQIGQGQHTPQNNNTQSSPTHGKGKKGSKSPSKNRVLSPRTTTGETQGLKSSVSANNISYSYIVASSVQAPKDKNFQPILRTPNVNSKSISGGLTGIGPTVGGGHVRRSTHGSGGSFSSILGGGGGTKSGGLNSRSGSKPHIMIKEQPFNYEEKRQAKTQKSADHLQAKAQNNESANRGNDFKSVSQNLNNQYRSVPDSQIKVAGQNNQNNRGEDEDYNPINDNILPGSFLNQGDDRDGEVRMRHSEDVSLSQDQQFLLAFGSGFTHSRLDSGQLWLSSPNTQPMTQQNSHPRKMDADLLQAQNNSNYKGYEENKSEVKQEHQPHYNYVINTTNTDEEKFEVIRCEDQNNTTRNHAQVTLDADDTKDALYRDSFYSPKSGNQIGHSPNTGMNYQPIQTLEQRMNSDMKKFIHDEDEMEQAAARRMGIASGFNKGIGQEWLEKVHEGQRQSARFNIVTTGEEMKIEDLQDTPKNIKDRTKRSLKENIFQDQITIGQANMFGLPYDSQQNPIILQSLGDFPQQTHAHVLSFSEDNPIFNQAVHLGLTDPTKQSQPNALLQSSSFTNLQETRPQSQLVNAENALSQLAQLKASSPLMSSHLPQSANTIIEMEKNYVILQYESLLQQLSSEFQKILGKTKETDEHLAQQELLLQTQQKIIQEKEAAQFQQEQLNSQLSNQVQQLLQELEQVTVEKSRREQYETQNDEALNVERDMMRDHIQKLQSRVKQMESQEILYRDQIDQANVRSRQIEAKLRQNEEEVFQKGREAQGIIRDLNNMKEIENGLKLEVQRGQTARVALEEQVQEMRQRAIADQMMLRLRDNEIESINREFKALKGSFETLQLSLAQVMRENDQLKATLGEHERSNIQMKSIFQTRDAQTTQLETDVGRLKTIIEKERQRSNQVEEEYQRKIETLQSEIRDLHQKRDYDQMQFKQQLESRMNNSGHMQDHIQANRYSIGSPLNESMTANRNSISLNDNQPQINWPRNVPLQQLQQNQSVVPSAQKQSHPPLNQEFPQKRIVNQNQSQLQDLLHWGADSNNKPQNQGVPAAGIRSLERPNTANPIANLYSQVRQSMMQAPNANQQINQFSPRANNAVPNKQSFSEPDALQAAGKKSDINQLPPNHPDAQRQLSYLQNNLSGMMVEKERLENEYRKLGTSKNKQQIERKKELEFEQDILNKNIHQIKQRLREMNAL